MASLTFADHEAFQTTVVRAVAGAAAAGLAFQLVGGLGVPLAVLALGAAAAVACDRSTRTRVAYGLLAALGGTAPLFFPQHPVFGLLTSGAVFGLLLAHFREGGTRKDAGQPRMGRLTFAAAAVASAVAMLAAVAVVRAFDSHGLIDNFLPGALAHASRGALYGFFLGLGAAGAHVGYDADPVERLYESLLAELAGDLKVLAGRAMTNYRRCAEVLANSEPGFARNQLSKSLTDVTTRILELAKRWQGIDRELGARAEGEIGQRLAELLMLKEQTKDEIAKKQLGVAEMALKSELDQLDRIRRGRERVVARLHGEMALLERTRFALLGLKSSDAHLRAAELSAISDSLSTIAREMDCEAQAVDEVISKVVEVGSSDAAAADPSRVRA